MDLKVDPGFVSDLELISIAFEMGWPTQEVLERTPFLPYDGTSGIFLQDLLPLTTDQR